MAVPVRPPGRRASAAPTPRPPTRPIRRRPTTRAGPATPTRPTISTTDYPTDTDGPRPPTTRAPRSRRRNRRPASSGCRTSRASPSTCRSPGSAATGGASVYYESQDASGLIQIFALTSPETTPYDSLKATEETVSGNDDYQLLGLRYIIDDDASDAAELEYTYVRDDGSTRHVVDRAFTGPDGVQYALLVAGPDSDWSTYQNVFQVLRASFCPSGYCTR